MWNENYWIWFVFVRVDVWRQRIYFPININQQRWIHTAACNNGQSRKDKSKDILINYKFLVLKAMLVFLTNIHEKQ